MSDDDEKALRYFGEVAKRELRTRMRSVRSVLPAAAREERSQEAIKRVLAMPEFQHARTVLGFSAIQKEIDPAQLLAAARAAGKTTGLPRVDDERLVLHAVQDANELEEGAFGVMEPVASAPVIAPEDVDLVIVPGLAFDHRGHRLGYGRAFYDRLLPSMPQAFRIGLGYDFQVLMELPIGPHDVPLHAVVTDKQVLRIASS